MAEGMLPKKGTRVYRQSLIPALATYAILIVFALFFQILEDRAAVFIHLVAFALSPFFAAQLRNRRVEVDSQFIRSYDWRGRLRVESNFEGITGISLGKDEERLHFTTTQGDIYFEGLKGWRDLVRHVASIKGISIKGSIILGL